MPTMPSAARQTTYTVGEVAKAAGITVRTLHHYDEVGLAPPSYRSPSGYRLYTTGDLHRLQQVLFYRELDFGLDEIAALLAGDEDSSTHLRRQRKLLLARRARLDRLVQTLEQTMDARRLGVNLTPDEILDVFGDHDPTIHADEAEERWSETDAWAQSRSRAATYTKDDWKRITDEQEALMVQLTETFQAGEAPDSTAAMDLAEEARQQINRWFYDLGYGGHRCLGTMFVSDPRFRETYDTRADGLAVWFRDAIRANAARHGITEDRWD